MIFCVAVTRILYDLKNCIVAFSVVPPLRGSYRIPFDFYKRCHRYAVRDYTALVSINGVTATRFLRHNTFHNRVAVVPFIETVANTYGAA